MRFRHLLLLVLFSGLFVANTSAQTKNNEQDVTVFDSVLKTADWANFKYQEELEKAKRNDMESIYRLLDFSGTVDGKEAIEHSVTLLELMAGRDAHYAGGILKTSPKLKAVLLERFALAQGKTQKEELRKPISEWAPLSWGVLHGKEYMPPLTEEQARVLGQLKMEKDNMPKHKPGTAPAENTDAQPSKTGTGHSDKDN